jgi:hypothetical protein
MLRCVACVNLGKQGVKVCGGMAQLVPQHMGELSQPLVRARVLHDVEVALLQPQLCLLQLGLRPRTAATSGPRQQQQEAAPWWSH